GSDHRNGKTIYGARKPLACTRELESFRPAKLGNLFEIGAGGKKFVVAGDDQTLDLAIPGFFLQALHGVVQRLNDRARKNVRWLRRRDTENGAAINVGQVLILDSALSPNLHSSRQ